MEQLSARQLAEWEAYDQIDPLLTEDYKLAYFSSFITNLFIQAYSKKGTKLTKVEDFLIVKPEKEVKKQSVADMKKILLDIANAQNKKVGHNKTIKK